MMAQKNVTESFGTTITTLGLTGLGVFLTGLGAGITLALLFAPLSGADTRNLIGRTAKESENWVKDTAKAAQGGEGAEIRSRAEEVVGAFRRG